jgi:radical SAM superfamily enzyme YgiQ (UPF0313 family)
MRVLLLAMPDVASSFDRVMRFPNLGLVSLAANLDGADVRVLDLVLHSRAVGQAVRRALADFEPGLVGLSAMTFQYDTAKQVAAIVRRELPSAKTVLGGYHATLAYDEIVADSEAEAFDFLVRGEGERALAELVHALANGSGYEGIGGLSYRTEAGFVHNPRRPLVDLSSLRLPDRRARLSTGFYYFGRRFDVVETSRGCTRACRFCSIHRMYGSEHRSHEIGRVIADIAAAAEAGAQGIFFVDDNINLDPARLDELCRAIVAAGLDRLEYISQADVAGFARAPELAASMKRAGFSALFLGIESVNKDDWRFLRKSNALTTTREVISTLRGNGIGAAGGFILGNPSDNADSIKAAFHNARTLGLDHAIMWCLTPYPGTEIRGDLMAEDLVTNPHDYRRYNGYICNVRTRHLTHRQLIRTIAAEGLKLYFHPGFLAHGRVWGRNGNSVLPYLQASAEYLTRGFRNQLYASRHRI